MRSLRRIILLCVCLGAGTGTGWWVFRHSPVQYLATARLIVPHEAIAGLDRSILPLDDLSGSNTGELSSAALGAAVEQLQSRGIVWNEPNPFQLEIDQLRAAVSVSVEKQAGQTEYLIRFQSSRPEQAPAVVGALTEACLQDFSELRAGRTSSVQAELDQQLAKQTTAAAELEARIKAKRAERAALTVTEATRPASTEKMKSLGNGVAEAKRRRLEAENRLSQARHDLQAQLPLELIVARLPDSESKRLLEKSLGQLNQVQQIDQLREQLDRLSQVYGAQHPKIIQTTAQLTDLQTQLANLSAELGADDPKQGAADLLVRLLESDWREQQANERDLSDQLLAEEQALQGFDQIEGDLQALQAEVTSGQKQRDELLQKLQLERERVSALTPRISEPASLQPEPVSWKLDQYLLCGAGGGLGSWLLLFSLGLMWRRPQPLLADLDLQTVAAAEDEPSGLLAIRRRARLSRLNQLQARAA